MYGTAIQATGSERMRDQIGGGKTIGRGRKMQPQNPHRPGGLLAAAVFAIALAGAGSVPALGQQPKIVNEAIRLKTYPVKMDPALGAGVARIGKGRLHQEDVTLIEIPPGKSLPPRHHLAEEVIYVVSGKGSMEMWPSASRKSEMVKYDWSEGDYLSPTLNAWYRLVNASPDRPARMVSITTAPLTEEVFHNAELLQSEDTVFESRWKWSVGHKAEYDPSAAEGPNTVRMLVGNILPDLVNRPMRNRGEAMSGITITPDGDMAGNRLLEMEAREFLTPDATTPDHRHVWETVYIVLKGDGYAILQRKGEPERRLNWTAGDLFIVGANEYHNLRPLHGSHARFLEVKPSGYFRRVGLAPNFLMQNKPGTSVHLR
jgi:quercetin dioxygenase-like cupin family protein